jgi:hypothetical protein
MDYGSLLLQTDTLVLFHATDNRGSVYKLAYLHVSASVLSYHQPPIHSNYRRVISNDSTFLFNG